MCYQHHHHASLLPLLLYSTRNLFAVSFVIVLYPPFITRLGNNNDGTQSTIFCIHFSFFFLLFIFIMIISEWKWGVVCEDICFGWNSCNILSHKLSDSPFCCCCCCIIVLLLNEKVWLSHSRIALYNKHQIAYIVWCRLKWGRQTKNGNKKNESRYGEGKVRVENLWSFFQFISFLFLQ